MAANDRRASRLDPPVPVERSQKLLGVLRHDLLVEISANAQSI